MIQSEKTLIMSDGCHLCCREYRFPSTRNIGCVFVHGLTGDQAAWEFVVESLSKKPIFSSICTFDLRMHGKSEHLYPQYEDFVYRSAKDLGELLESYIAENKLEKIVLVGHSFGSIVVQEYFQHFKKHPIVCAVLVSVPDHLKGVRFPSFIAKFFARFPTTVCFRTKSDHAKYVGTWDIDLRRLWSDIRSVGFFHFLCVYCASLGWSVRGIFPRIPTLILAGRKDIFFTAQEMESFAKRYRAKYVEVETGNHCLPTNSANEVAHQIRLFVERCISEPPCIG